YAASVILNGPLADRFGGRRMILIGALGAAVMNAIIGLTFLSGASSHVVIWFAVLYGMNMYFQSFGALSVVKVNAPWFHLTERGIFGGIFGIMISSGYALALGVGGLIIAPYTAADPATHERVLLPGWYLIFFIPSALMLIMAGVDFLLVK